MEATEERIIVQTMLDSDDHPGDVLKDTHLSIFFNYYTNTTVWAENLDVRQDVNYRILDIMKEEQVDFVSPGHSLFELKKMKDESEAPALIS